MPGGSKIRVTGDRVVAGRSADSVPAGHYATQHELLVAADEAVTGSGLA
jgi:hypothetical protein